MAEDVGAEDMKKTAFMPKKTERKQKLFVDPMAESSWKSTDYLAPAKESISLVGKSTGMMSTTSRGFAPRLLGLVK